MEITKTARRPFERCAIDIVGPNTETRKENRYILTFQDDQTKFVVAEPIRGQDADTVAREFVRNIVLKFGALEVSLSDQGLNFLSELFRNTCKLLRIKTINTTSFHPESNGGLERVHRVRVVDKVLLFDESVRRGRSKKLGAKWIGPYVFLTVEGVNATITRGKEAVKVHTNRLKPFYKAPGESTIRET